MCDIFESAQSELKEVLHEIGGEVLPDRGVLVVDPDGSVRCANPRMAEMLGMDLGELVGADYRTRVWNHLRGGELSESPESVSEYQPGDEVITLRGETGDKYLHCYSTPLLDADGKVAGRIEVYSDISGRRRMEQMVLQRQLNLALQNEELRQAQDTLIRTVKLAALGEMAAGVAHHLNNVLGVILGNIQLILKRDIDQDVCEKLRTCELAAKDGAGTVSRIRSLSWWDESTPSAHVDLNAVVREVVLLTKSGRDNGQGSGLGEVDLKVQSHPVPPVRGSAAELREALGNIVLNAVQSMPNGGTVNIGTTAEDGCVLVSVEDTGIGMTDEVKRRVFSPFYTTRGRNGTGLGMSIADAVVTKHGGSIHIESEPGNGTCIVVRVPVAKDLSDKPERIEALRPLAADQEATDSILDRTAALDVY